MQTEKSQIDNEMLYRSIALDMVAFLKESAEDNARSSRDFGRGFMYAVRVLEEQYLEQPTGIDRRHR